MYGLKSLCSWACWSRLGLAIPEGLPGICTQLSLQTIEYPYTKYISPAPHCEAFKGRAETLHQGIWLPGSIEIGCMSFATSLLVGGIMWEASGWMRVCDGSLQDTK